MTNLVAFQNMKEFDPACERHKPLLIVKAVDPGCTLEVQIENAISGEVVRITTTDSASDDDKAFKKALLEQFEKALAGVEF